MKFSVLASGSKGNCCVIKNDETSIVIDCGQTMKYIKSAFALINMDYMSANALILTHEHTDHIQSLKLFQNHQIYTPFKVDYPYQEVHPFEHFEIGCFKITPLPLSHDATNPCGYIIEDGNETLAYITDTGYLNEQLKTYLENLDYYIFESNHDPRMLMQTTRPYYTKQRILSDVGHLSNEDSAKVLCEVMGDKTKEIILAHISQEANHYDLAKDVLLSKLLKQEVEVRSAKQTQILIGGKR